MIRTICSALALVTAFAPAAANIDSTGAVGTTVYAFGQPNTATYGQVFVPGAGDSHLASFSLYLVDRYAGSGPLDVRGYLAEWDGTKAGTLLFSSPTVTMNAAGTLQEMAFGTDLLLTQGKEYVAFLSTSELPAGAESLFGMPQTADVIDGTFVFANSGSDFGTLFTAGWSGFGGEDIWFKADFGNESAVPEPSAWVLLIGGFGLVGAAARRGRGTTGATPSSG